MGSRRPREVASSGCSSPRWRGRSWSKGLGWGRVGSMRISNIPPSKDARRSAGCHRSGSRRRRRDVGAPPPMRGLMHQIRRRRPGRSKSPTPAAGRSCFGAKADVGPPCGSRFGRGSRTSRLEGTWGRARFVTSRPPMNRRVPHAAERLRGRAAQGRARLKWLIPRAWGLGGGKGRTAKGRRPSRPWPGQAVAVAETAGDAGSGAGRPRGRHGSVTGEGRKRDGTRGSWGRCREGHASVRVGQHALSR